MKIDRCTLELDCKLNVSRDTAETCLKLIEIFLNENGNLDIVQDTRVDGTVALNFYGISRKED